MKFNKWYYSASSEMGLVFDSETHNTILPFTVLGEGTSKKQHANARLIAAAPDLLEALKGLHGALSRMIDKYNPDDIEGEWLQHSNEAIIKAEGR